LVPRPRRLLPAGRPCAAAAHAGRPRRLCSAQYPGYGFETGAPPPDEPAVLAGWATCQVNFWPPKASLKPSPVTLPGLSSVNEYRSLPLYATCLPPSGRLTTTSLPGSDAPFAVPLTVSGFQKERQAPVHITLPPRSSSFE